MRSSFNIVLALIYFFTINACKTAEPQTESTVPPIEERSVLDLLFEESDIFSQSITGFALYDPESNSLIYNRDADRFFTPASNTKILTLYASLNTLPEKLPSIRYQVRNDTLYFRGTGDPAFLNPEFDFNSAFEFLKNRPEKLIYYDSHFKDEHFGPGWAWDWYPASYAPEKSPFPIYGNIMRMQEQQISAVMLNAEEPVKPRFFERYIRNPGMDDQRELVRRDQQSNEIFYVPKSDTVHQVRNIPFRYERELLVEMLADTLGREVGYTDNPNIDFSETFYGTDADTLYRRMMQVSDNFIAEQLMLMISDKQFGMMKSEDAIQYSLSNYLHGLPQQPRWSDGSGLTRYNLVTPHSLVVLLEKLMDEYGEEKTLSWFPVGGVSGTIRGLYRAPSGEQPYVFAKTGTLRNNTALSGYIFTRSGKRLNFSIINNNYVIGNNEIRAEMGRLLELIREQY